MAEEIRADYAARYGKPVSPVVEAGRVRNFLLALDEPLPSGWDGAVPPLSLLTLGHTRRPQPARGSAFNAADEHEFFADAHVGDTITTSRAIVDIKEKHGTRGVMYLMRSESTYTNQNGLRAALSRQSTLCW